MPDSRADRTIIAAPVQERRTYHALDALRGVAAILVVLYHAEHVLGFSLVPNGYLAVDLFFVLSGFVISYAYDRRLSAGLGVARFALMRMIRFWPLYAAGLLCGLLLQVCFTWTDHHLAMPAGKVMASFLLSLLFLPTLFETYGNTLFPLNPVSWSLFFELVVNILYACFLPVLSTRVLRWTAMLSGLAFILLAAVHGTTNVGWSTTQVWAGLFRTLYSFCVGACLFRGGVRMKAPPLWLLTGLVVLCLCLPLPAALFPYFATAFILIISPAIVAAGAAADVSPRTATVAALLGATSYALYALHRPLLSFADAAGSAAGLPGPATCALFLVLLCALCPLVDRYYDAPMRRRLAGWFGLLASPVRQRTA